MGSINFVIIFCQFFNVLAWPSIPLMFPLYASIRAIKCDQESVYQQCLKYWVLFSMATIFECALSKLLVWLYVWPYIKGVATVLLIVPSFAGASYVYTRFVHIAEDSCFRDMLLIPESITIEQNEFSDQASSHTSENGEEESENCVSYELSGMAAKLRNEPGTVGTIDTDHTMIGVLLQPGCLKKVQREWSCPLCLIITTSAKDLRMHIRGKKHKLKKMEDKQKNAAATKETTISLTKKKANFLTRFNFHNMSGFAALVKRSDRWSVWIKPDFGWTKLNTDGSIDKENAGFGGLFRDYRGNAVCAYVSKYPGDDIFLAELRAIWRGLIVALGLGIKVIWVESDSMSVVKTINKEQPYGPKASSCLKHTWKLLKKFDKSRVSHSWRETNRAADYLAKMDLSGSDVVLWPGDFPCGLSRIIEEDALGTKYYRR
ncbi:uncharacterized protein LOC111396815 isoform X2 [Olea europaea subsp. europaea]|uniref:Uncharacterized protein LOC111396815 isoform X2 n=3 Tax=Olea europaea subsp. europaea TaxID=158383 RepID=A0A8S0TRF5_OLEEU|nr:uncharacterized protein LOC111396815 isoform X2 [Olea europaea subsp. europaea]